MRRVVLRVREPALEDVLDALLPRLADGVHERPAGDGTVELIAHGLTAPLPSAAELARCAGAALISLDEHAVPDDWRERRRRDGAGGVAVGGRFWLRSSLDPPPAAGLLDVVVEHGAGFGTGAHPTTRMCLELLARLAPRGGFADLGCGAGALAIAAAKLGFSPVDVVDHDPGSVDAALENARRNDVTVRGHVLDLLAAAAPRARVIAANVPALVHGGVAQRLAADVELVLASGIGPQERAGVCAVYARAGFAVSDEHEQSGWLAIALQRVGG